MTKRAFLIYCGVILAAGVILRALPLFVSEPPHHSASWLLLESSAGIGEALIVATLLALLVDSYAKLRLATDIGEEIATKVHGYHLPEELREELNAINNFTFILRNFKWDIELRAGAAGDGSYVWRWIITYDVENITYDDQKFTHSAAASANLRNNENLDTVTIVGVKHTVNDEKIYSLAPGDPEFDKDFRIEGALKIWTSTKPVTIPARNFESKGVAKYTFYSSAEKLVDEYEVQELMLRYPCIGMHVKIAAPADINIVISLEVSGGAERESFGYANAYEWRTERVFLRNQGIWIKHERKIPAASGTLSAETAK